MAAACIRSINATAAGQGMPPHRVIYLWGPLSLFAPLLSLFHPVCSKLVSAYCSLWRMPLSSIVFALYLFLLVTLCKMLALPLALAIVHFGLWQLAPPRLWDTVQHGMLPLYS
jgi:hypothetical protein